MNISPFEIYLVMQLDSISATLLLFTIMGISAAAITLLFGTITTDRGYYPSDKQDQTWEQVKRLALRIGVATAVVASINAFIPSTKTVAAMIVIPAIANNDAIQREAGDLYSLAKDALREAVNSDTDKE